MDLAEPASNVSAAWLQGSKFVFSAEHAEGVSIDSSSRGLNAKVHCKARDSCSIHAIIQYEDHGQSLNGIAILCPMIYEGPLTYHNSNCCIILIL